MDTYSPTNKLYAAVANWLTSGTGADQPSYMGLESSSTITAFTATTNAGVTTLSGSLCIVATTKTCITTTVASDTCQAYVLFTCGGSSTATVWGAYCFNNSTPTNMLSWHAYAASVTLNSGDTLAETMTHQCEIGA